MEQVKCWNSWIKEIDSADKELINNEIAKLQENETIPFVERNLKLGYLYYQADCIAKATTIFSEVSKTIKLHINEPSFVKENKDGLGVMYMGYRVDSDGCGGFEIIETGCGPDVCVPVCCCLGLVTVMACCGIEADQVFDFDYATKSATCCGMSQCCGQPC